MGRLRSMLLLCAAVLIVTTSCLFDSDEDIYGIDGYVRDAGGQPVEGVLIRKTGSESGSTYTRSNGYYWVPVNGWSEEVALAAVKSGWAFCPGLLEFTDLRARHHDQNFTGFYGGEVVIDGFVIDSGGSPVEGVKVVNRQSGILYGLTSVTNYLGYYRFNNVIAGYSYRFQPYKPGCVFNPSERMYAFPAHDYLHQDFTISCVGSFEVSGRVTDPEGGPVEGVELLITPGGFTVTTDEDGRYSKKGLVPSESMMVTPSKDGCEFTPDSAEVSAPFGNIRDVDFTAWCGETHTLSGCVRGPTGDPRPDLVLTVEGGRFSPPNQVRTDEAGYYAFPAAYAGYDYVIRPSRITFAVEPESIAVDALDGDRHNLDFEASAEILYVWISGYVRDKEGNPVEGIVASHMFHPPAFGGPGEGGREASAASQSGLTTDADGYYSVDVPIGWEGSVNPYKPDCLVIPLYREYVADGDYDNQDFVIYCGDGYRVSGRVADAAGSPAMNVPIVADGEFSYHRLVYTDASGYYEFTNQPADVEITVTPSSGYSIPYEGCIFCPPERVYESIENDYAGQNFTLSCPGP